MKNQSITEAMLQFIEESPTAFHAAANVEALLLENGFEKLDNLAEGALVPGGSYYTMQNGSAVLAVKIPENLAKGFRITASHSDSPCFKIKEMPEMKVENTYVKLNVEKYGGMILSPWLDRPLSVAGRVFVAGKDGKPEAKLVNLKKDLLIIPNVAIHFNRNQQWLCIQSADRHGTADGAGSGAFDQKAVRRSGRRGGRGDSWQRSVCV